MNNAIIGIGLYLAVFTGFMLTAFTGYVEVGFSYGLLILLFFVLLALFDHYWKDFKWSLGILDEPGVINENDLDYI